MINRVVLTGRLTKDSQVRYTQSGAAVASFNLAVNRPFTNAQGEREADFIQCVIWRKAAENFNNFTHKGSLVGIDGRIQTRNYENNQGRRVYVTEVVVDNFSLLESRKAESSQPKENQKYQSHEKPAAKPKTDQKQTPEPVTDSDVPLDISDDDLPF